MTDYEKGRQDVIKEIKDFIQKIDKREISGIDLLLDLILFLKRLNN